MKKFNEKNSKESFKEKIVAYIPLRGGSKSIRLKNIKELFGKPLVYWTLLAASDCEWIDEIYVATDNDEIHNTVISLGINKVNVITRSAENASDQASTESAMLEFATAFMFDHIVLIQATSPLTKVHDLESAIEIYVNSPCDSLVTVVRQKRFIWEEQGEYGTPQNYNPLKRPLRQEWNGFYVENGAFYVTSREALMKSECRISGNIKLFEMKEETYFELDEKSDWIITEQLKRTQLINESDINNNNLDKINLLICDVDGVLTDAGMYYSDQGDELKKFNTRDGKGIELIKNAGVKVMFLTSEKIGLVERRAEKLQIDFLCMGIKDKKSFLDNFYAQNKTFSFNQTAYIGDDINDYDCMKASYFSATPKDGHNKIKEIATYTCDQNGGQGCVREVCELIISRRNYG